MGAEGPSVEVIDPQTWRLLQRLQACGHVQRVATSARVVHQSPRLAENEAARHAAARAQALRAQADRALRKAQILAAGGFPEEVPPLLLSALGYAGAAQLALRGDQPDEAAIAQPIELRTLVARKALPAHVLATFDRLSAAGGPPCEVEAGRLVTATADVLANCSLG